MQNLCLVGNKNSWRYMKEYDILNAEGREAIREAKYNLCAGCFNMFVQHWHWMCPKEIANYLDYAIDGGIPVDLRNPPMKGGRYATFDREEFGMFGTEPKYYDLVPNNAIKGRYWDL